VSIDVTRITGPSRYSNASSLITEVSPRPFRRFGWPRAVSMTLLVFLTDSRNRAIERQEGSQVDYLGIDTLPFSLSAASSAVYTIAP
jgi:hypothetical protein